MVGPGVGEPYVVVSSRFMPSDGGAEEMAQAAGADPAEGNSLAINGGEGAATQRRRLKFCWCEFADFRYREYAD